jgi:hypothetical protein
MMVVVMVVVVVCNNNYRPATTLSRQFKSNKSQSSKESPVGEVESS